MKYKQSKIKDSDFLITPLNVDFRFYASFSGGLNIVPVDLAAKIMYHASVMNDSNESYHLTAREETSHRMYTSLMLKAINLTGVKNVDTMPKGLNQLEALYYKSVGQILTPYIEQDPILFDTTSSEEVCRKVGISYTAISNNNFKELMQYATDRRFGIAYNNIGNKVANNQILEKPKSDIDYRTYFQNDLNIAAQSLIEQRVGIF